VEYDYFEICFILPLLIVDAELFYLHLKYLADIDFNFLRYNFYNE